SIIIEHLIRRCPVNDRTISARLKAWMQRRRMVRTQWGGESMQRPLDQRLLIDRTRDGLAHFLVRGQHRIVKVKEERFETGTRGRGDECIAAELLIRLESEASTQLRGVNSTCLEILEDGVVTGGNAEHQLVQVGKTLAGQVIAGVAHQR